MKLDTLKNADLNDRLLTMVKSERRLTSQILEYLKEVEDRRLYAKRGFPSLFAYCTDFLGYSEGAAQRRISSMRLLRQLPEIKTPIVSGELSLSNLSKAASFFRSEKKDHGKTYTLQEKKEVLASLQSKTQKQAETELVKINPKVFAQRNLERPLNPELTELKIILNSETMKKLHRLKELKPGLSTPELLNWMLSRSLRQVDPMIKPKRSGKLKSTSECDQQAKPVTSTRFTATAEPEHSLPQRHRPLAQRRSLSRKIKHAVWQRAGGSCQFKDHGTGRICKRTSGLEIDHIQPLSLGGRDDTENLRLLCRSHHKLFTMQTFNGLQFEIQKPQGHQENKVLSGSKPLNTRAVRKESETGLELAELV